MRTLRIALAAGLLLAGMTSLSSAQSSLAARMIGAIQAAGVPVVGLSIGDTGNRATWKVQPATLQSAAQPTIDTFNPNDPTLDTADLDTAVKVALDQERLESAVVWTIIDTYSPPATIAKYQAARTKIVAAYKARPWVP